MQYITLQTIRLALTTLELLDYRIGACTLCNSFEPLIKNPSLRRGGKSDIMVIGLAPGTTETTEGIAFSGSAGRKLFQWLLEARIGESTAEIRERVYFTSLIKCQKSDIGDIIKMFKNCQSFLKQQIELVGPKIIIPLGPSVYNILFNSSLSTEDIVGKLFTFDDLNDMPLFPEMSLVFGVKYIIPFPHPSGLNRWLNSDENNLILLRSIQILNSTYYEEQ